MQRAYTVNKYENIDMLLKNLSTCRGTVYPRLWPVLLHSFAFLGQIAALQT